MIDNKNKTTAIVLGIFALVIVTTAASFAFFTYSRVGNTTTTITSGDIEFTYKEGEDASLANAFPVSDSVGANDTSEEYTFTVNLKSSSASNKMNYNVYLLDANDDENTNYFTNEQIKFALVKDGTFVAGTSATEGKKLSSIPGFTAGEYEGEGLVLESQEITAGKTDEYKLRIWISDDVNYSNTDRVDDNTDEFNDAQTSTGKYNGSKYSLKVKVTSEVVTNNNLTAEIATTKIKNLAATNTNELRIDEHAAVGQQTFETTEYRYYGATPNNYVEFNNELWRIIGVFKVDDGSGNIEERLKIIRANSIGDYSWDSSASEVNNGRGVNEWNRADLMKLLNSGAYYNRTTGTCYNGASNATTSCDFSATSTTPGLTSEAKEMIGNVKWYLGAGPIDYSTLTSADFYEYERGTDSGKQCSNETFCNDAVTRTTFWIGQIGLMYPSDQGYSANMTSCSSTALVSYNTSCRKSSWLFNYSYNQWTLTPMPNSSYASNVFYIGSNGQALYFNAYIVHGVHPVTYLKSDIKIIDGIGTDQQPFKLSLN